MGWRTDCKKEDKMNEKKMELFCRVGGKDKELAAAGRAGKAAVYENGCLQAFLYEESLGDEGS